MKKILLLVLAVCLFIVAGCSLPPEKPVTKDQLYNTGLYNFYTIKESPESVLAALNREGEVVLEATYRDQPVYIKIMALTTGLQVSVYER